MSAARRAGLGRRAAVLMVAATGAALLGVGAAPWLSVPVTTAIADDVAVVVGSDAVPTVPAAGLVLLAAGVALALAGRVTRVAAGVAVAVVGLLAVVGVAGFLADPSQVAVAAVAAVTGIRAADAAPTVTGWPVAALVLASCAVAVGALVPVAARAWSTQARSRYDRPTGAPVSDARPGQETDDGANAGSADAMADWDALSRGEDPS